MSRFLSGRISEHFKKELKSLHDDAARKGIRLLSNRFISADREAEYEKFGITALRPRATLFCSIGGVGIAMYSITRWLSGESMDASKNTLMLVRVAVSTLSLLLLPCTYLYPKHWKRAISAFIVMNTLTFIVYNYRKILIEVDVTAKDIMLFYKFWNLSDDKSLGEYVPRHTGKAFSQVSDFNPRTSSEALLYAFITLLFNGAWVPYPLYALLTGMFCGLGAVWSVVGSGMCEVVYVVLVCVAYDDNAKLNVDVADLLVNILIFAAISFMAHRFDQHQRITVSTLSESSRRHYALRSAMIRHISGTGSRMRSGESEAYDITQGQYKSDVTVKVQSKLERAIRKLSNLSNSVNSATEKKLLDNIVLDLSTANMQAYRPDLEKELEKVSDDNLVKKWLLQLDPNSVRRSSFEAGTANEMSGHDIEMSEKDETSKSMSNSDAIRLSNQFTNSSITYINDNTNKIMKNASDWTVDMFDLANASHGNPLQCVSFTVFIENENILDSLNIEVGNLMMYIKRIEAAYLDKPYHNSIHAADVLYGTYYISNVLEYGKSFTPLEKFALFFSAAVHDVGHLGVSNNFLVRSKSDLAITYNDTSVLEHMHLSLAFSIGQKVGFFEVFPYTVYTEFRKHVIDMVLATDLGQHMAFVAQLKAFKANGKNKLHEEKYIFMKTIIKLCDIGHSLKGLSVHLKWTERIVEEFFLQGDEEKSRGMPVSPFMDRNSPDTPKNQIGFFEFIVLPFWQTATVLADKLEPLVDEGKRNYNYWVDLRKKSIESRALKRKQSRQLRGDVSKS